MKYIVASGCSFTRQEKRLNLEGTDSDYLSDFLEMWRWPHWIQKLYGVKLYNMGSATNDNWTIARSTIYKVDKLLKDGISPDDIKVMIQWSSWPRESFFVSTHKNKELGQTLDVKTHHTLAHISDWIEEKEFNGQNGYWFLSGGHNLDHVENKVKNFMYPYMEYIKSMEQCFINHLEAKLYLQNYLNANNIKYCSFDIQNNFSKEFVAEEGFGFPDYRENTNQKYSDKIYFDKFIPNTWKSDLEYDYSDKPYIKQLLGMLDESNHWYYEEEGLTKYGGQIEWAIRNFNRDEFDLLPVEMRGREVNCRILFMEHAETAIHNLDGVLDYMDNRFFLGHVSSYMNRIFVEKILNKFLQENNIKKILI